MAWAEVVVDRLVATGFIRPAVLWRGLQRCRPSLSRRGVGVLISLNGLMVEPLAWLQSLLFDQHLRRVQLPDDPIVVIGHWRSATICLRQTLVWDPTVATARKMLRVALSGIAAQALDRSLAEGLDDRGPADRSGPMGPE